jgi:hypothetical protein
MARPSLQTALNIPIAQSTDECVAQVSMISGTAVTRSKWRPSPAALSVIPAEPGDSRMTSLWTTPVTSSTDGHQHDVTDEAYQAYRSNSAGLVALCGHEVRMQAGALPPGGPCQTCHRIIIGRGPHAHLAQPRVDVEQLQTRLGVPTQRIRTRHRRHGSLFRRLLHHSGPTGSHRDHKAASATGSARGGRSNGTAQ